MTFKNIYLLQLAPPLVRLPGVVRVVSREGGRERERRRAGKMKRGRRGEREREREQVK